METIFISIASYRDPELLPTLRDCIANAKQSDRLVFGICRQFHPDDKFDVLDEFKNDQRFKVVNVPYEHSKGTCWARNMIQDLYDGETYYMQLDSHHRFTKNWDLTLIKMLKQLKKLGHKKPLLTAYLPGFFPDNDPVGRVQDCWNLEFDRYMPEGPIFIKPHSIDGWQNLESPYPARFLSYTHGYDLFQPHIPVIWHEYTRNGKTKQWDDDKEWAEKNKVSYSRYRALHGMGSVIEGTTKDLFEKYGWGKERSLHEYERYIGVRFSTRQVHKHTSEYLPLPVPQEDFEENLVNRIKVCIDYWKGALVEPDYDLLVVAILDKNGEDIFRQDVDKNELNSLINSDPQDQFIHIWREYDDNKQPSKWRVWPHSESKGYLERTDQDIPYE
jgi:hypothetical protein